MTHRGPGTHPRGGGRWGSPRAGPAGAATAWTRTRRASRAWRHRTAWRPAAARPASGPPGAPALPGCGTACQDGRAGCSQATIAGHGCSHLPRHRGWTHTPVAPGHAQQLGFSCKHAASLPWQAGHNSSGGLLSQEDAWSRIQGLAPWLWPGTRHARHLGCSKGQAGMLWSPRPNDSIALKLPHGQLTKMGQRSIVGC